MNLQVKKLDEHANIPTYGSEFSAGLDIYSNTTLIIPPHSRSKVSTGIAICWTGPDEKNYYMRIAPRSGLSVKHSIDIGAGVIDWDYRGEIIVCVINNGNSEFVINQGDRIAQMILEKINRVSIVESFELNETARGTGGFGSTGIGL